MHLNDMLPLAAVAWSKVKPAGDPEFNNCALSHREKLVAEAEAVVRTGSARTDFEKAFLGLLDEFKAAQNPAPAAPAAAAIESAPEVAPEASEESGEGEGAEGGEGGPAEASAAAASPGRTRRRKSSAKGH